MTACTIEQTFPANPGFTAGFRTIPAGHTVPFHRHRFFELEIVASGTAFHLCGGRERPVSPGDAWLMTALPESVHSIRVPPGEPLTLANLSFSGSLPDAALTGVTAGRALVCRFGEDKLRRALDDIRALADEAPDAPFAPLFASSVINRLLIETARLAGVRTAAPPLVAEAEAWARKNLTAPLSEGALTAAAEALSVTPNYLGRLFRGSTGIPFTEYRTELRLRLACSVLSGGGSVKEAAAASGFTSAEYFCAVFRKRLGMTPNEWKRTPETLPAKTDREFTN